MIGTMSLGRIKGKPHLLVAAEHNKRTMYASGAIDDGSIDSSKTHLNYSLGGAPDPVSVVDRWRQLRNAAGITTAKRKDEVSAIEAVFSLPPGVESRIDLRSYFTDCTTFACKMFGGPENLLSSDVHLDQAQPHCHVLMLPLLQGRMAGSDLYWEGGKNHAKQHDAFFREVASRYGLQRPSPLTGASKKTAAKLVLDHLDTLEPDQKWSAVKNSTRAAIVRGPQPFLDELGLALPSKPKRTFEQIALSPGRGPKTRAAAEARDRAQMHYQRENRDEAIPIGFTAPEGQVSDAASAIPIGFEPDGDSSETHIAFAAVITPGRTLCSDRVPSSTRPTLPRSASIAAARRHHQAPISGAVHALLTAPPEAHPFGAAA